jgi:HEAT repeat protein
MPSVGQALSIGDRAFEARVHSTGPEALVLAALSHVSRTQRVFDRPWSGELRHGVLEYRDDDEPLVALTRELISAARALSVRPCEILPRLTNNLENDPEYQVRARNLQAIDGLLAHDRKRAHERARQALRDAHAAVRLIAARMLPDLTTVIRVARRDPDPHVRTSLLIHLSHFAGARLRPTLRSALASPHVEERRAAILAYGNIGDRWAAREIAEHAQGPELRVAEAVVEALARVGGSDSERALIALLAHRNRGIRVAASAALGKIGTIAAVEPLLDRGAHSAARAIQARLHGADAGRLTLVPDAHSGALSPAERDPGPGGLSAAD